MLIELFKEDIEIISNCILSEMSRKGNDSNITKEFEEARHKLLKRLQGINSYLCDNLNNYKEKKGKKK